MSLLENRIAYRTRSKSIENRNKVDKSVRVFGKIITNLDKINITNISENNNIGKSVQLFRKKTIPLNNYSKLAQKQILKEYDQQFMNSFVNKDYKSQKAKKCSITQNMRSILIDWLIDVHNSFQLSEQTLHLCFKYFEEYSSKQQITKKQLQLVGVTCLWIASKFQEIYPPKMNNFVQITADTYTSDQMKVMQGKIIQNLEFNLVKTTQLQLLQLALGDKIKQEFGSICKYLIQISTLYNILSNQKPSVVVLTVISVAQNILHEKSNITKFKEAFNTDNGDTKNLYRQMCKLLQEKGRKDNLKAIRNKYLSKKLHQVAKIQFQLK